MTSRRRSITWRTILARPRIWLQFNPQDVSALTAAIRVNGRSIQFLPYRGRKMMNDDCYRWFWRATGMAFNKDDLNPPWNLTEISAPDLQGTPDAFNWFTNTIHVATKGGDTTPGAHSFTLIGARDLLDAMGRRYNQH